MKTLGELLDEDFKTRPVDYALKYAELGFYVIPLHYPLNGRCSCGKGKDANGKDDCAVGKHPMLPKWPERATQDADVINGWWNKNPKANLGIVAGKKSGIVVLDVDPRHGGDESLKLLEEKHGKFPDTLRAITGGDGEHIIFRYPEGQTIKNKTSVAPGLDIRSDNGQIVAAPSVHASGKSYKWKNNLMETAIAEMPDWLLKMLIAEPEPKRQAEISVKTDCKINASPATSHIEEGRRNDRLTSIAGSLWKKGLSKEAVCAELKVQNKSACKPPLPESEVLTIVDSITNNYAPGNSSQAQNLEISAIGNTFVRVRFNPKTQSYETTKIASFVIEPLESILVDNSEYITANLISESGRIVYNFKFEPDAWTSKARFLGSLPGKEFTFYGSDRDIQLILNYLAYKDMVKKTGFNYVGLVSDAGRWLCVTRDGAYSPGSTRNDMVYMDRNVDYADIDYQDIPSRRQLH